MVRFILPIKAFKETGGIHIVSFPVGVGNVQLSAFAFPEKNLPTLIQTNETKKSTQIDAFFESKPKIDAFLKIDANAQRQEYKMAS